MANDGKPVANGFPKEDPSELSGSESDPLLAEREPVLMPEFECNRECAERMAKTAVGRLKPTFPLLPWLPVFGNTAWRDRLLGDMFGGLTAGFLLIPQGMAYSLIVGLPPVYGLYAGFLPTIVYSFFGSSGQASIGPVALMGVLAEEGISHVVGDFDADPERYIGAAAILAFQVGLVQILFGALGLGVLASILSHPVIEGFTMGGALVIFSKQLGSVFGISAKADSFFGTLEQFFLNIDESKWETILYSFISIFVLLAYKQYKGSKLPYAKTKTAKLFPIILAVLLVSILISYLAPSDNVAILGDIPEGLPTFVAPDVTSSDFGPLFASAFIISVLGFVESYSVSSKFAIILGYELDANKELIGLGWANFLPSFFESFPVAASFGRTAVVSDAGGRSPGQGIWTALVMLITLTLLTPIFKYIPLPVLGGIVMVAVSGLIKPSVFKHLWLSNKWDFLVMLATVVFILVFGIDLGIGFGVISSFVVMIVQSLFPVVEQMGHNPAYGTKEEHFPEFRKIKGNEHYGLKEITGVGIFSVEGVLHFANIARVRAAVLDYERMYRDNPDLRIHTVVLDFHRVVRIDQTAAHALHTARLQLEELDKEFPVRLRIARARPCIRHIIDAEHFYPPREEGDYRTVHERHFDSIHDAVTTLVDAYHRHRKAREDPLASATLSISTTRESYTMAGDASAANNVNKSGSGSGAASGVGEKNGDVDGAAVVANGDAAVASCRSSSSASSSPHESTSEGKETKPKGDAWIQEVKIDIEKTEKDVERDNSERQKSGESSVSGAAETPGVHKGASNRESETSPRADDDGDDSQDAVRAGVDLEAQNVLIDADEPSEPVEQEPIAASDSEREDSTGSLHGADSQDKKGSPKE